MEEPVKFKQAVLLCAITVAVAAGLVGCKKDDTAVNALQDLTNELSDQVAEQNKELTSLAEQHQTCVKDLAKTKNEAVVITATDATVEVPSLEGEANVTSLDALKKALNKSLDKQKAALTELKTKNEQCGKDLEAAKADAEAAATAEAEAAEAAEAKAAAAEAAAKKRAAAQKKAAAKKKAKQEKWK
jgi:colicin import membrane protein